MTGPKSAALGRLTLRVKRVEGVPVVAVRVWLLAGSRDEDLPGQAAITGRLLAEGSRKHDWREIVVRAESRGMAVWSSGGIEVIGVAADALARDWRRALQWSAELALEPAFPADRCRWVCRQAAAELESLADQPEIRTARSFLRQLYEPHPKSRPVLGTIESLGRLDRVHCERFHRRALAGGALVTVAGEIDEDRVLREAESLFEIREGGGSSRPGPPAPVGATESRARVGLGTGGTAHLYLGHLTTPANHPQLPALELAGVILGSGPGLHGRIPLQVRERRGLCYVTSVETAAEAGLDPGYLSVYLATEPENLAAAEKLVISELERMVADGPTETEVREARSYLLGREPFRRETARQWADLLARSEHYGLPLDSPSWVSDRILELDRRRVHDAVRQLLRPEELKIATGVPEPAE